MCTCILLPGLLLPGCTVCCYAKYKLSTKISFATNVVRMATLWFEAINLKRFRQNVITNGPSCVVHTRTDETMTQKIATQSSVELKLSGCDALGSIMLAIVVRFCEIVCCDTSPVDDKSRVVTSNALANLLGSVAFTSSFSNFGSECEIGSASGRRGPIEIAALANFVEYRTSFQDAERCIKLGLNLGLGLATVNIDM